jgi:hypothetical protein
MMKFIIRLAVILLLFVLYSQADAEILIYKTSIKGYEYNGISGVWEAIERKDRGYLILDIDYVNDEDDEKINVINAKEIKYWNDGVDHLYEEFDRDYYITRVEYRVNIWWFLTGSYASSIEVQALINKGETKDTSIDFNKDDTVEVANQLTGKNLSDIQLGYGHYIDTWSTTFRLHTSWTKLANSANHGNGDFGYAVDQIVKNYLIRRGYQEI